MEQNKSFAVKNTPFIILRIKVNGNHELFYHEHSESTYCDCCKLFYFIQVIIWKETSNGWAKLQEFCNHDSSGKAKRFQKILQMFIL